MATEKKRDLNQQLNTFGKGTFPGTGGHLAYIFQCVATKSGSNTLSRWGNLMHEFVTDPTNHIAQNRRDQTSARGNLTKEFVKRSMTWKVFLKGLKFLQFYKFELTFRFYRENDEVIDFTTVVPIKQRRYGMFQKDRENMQNDLKTVVPTNNEVSQPPNESDEA